MTFKCCANNKNILFKKMFLKSFMLTKAACIWSKCNLFDILINILYII